MIAWKLWAGVPRVALWEAVALVLEIDPKSLRQSPHAWQAGPGGGPMFEPRSFPSPEKLSAFNEGLGFAEKATTYSGPIRLTLDAVNGPSYRTADVSLREVVAFFAGCDWPDIPAPLLALLKGPTDAVSAAEPAPASIPVPSPAEPAAAAAAPLRASQGAEREAREDARLAHCEAQGLVFDADPLRPLPYGITKAAASLDPPITRQSLSTDVKAALRRRRERERAGKA